MAITAIQVPIVQRVQEHQFPALKVHSCRTQAGMKRVTVYLVLVDFTVKLKDFRMSQVRRYILVLLNITITEDSDVASEFSINVPITIQGPCQEGYYCQSEAETATPTDGTTGNECPAGFYCPNATANPIPCDDGKFLLKS